MVSVRLSIALRATAVVLAPLSISLIDAPAHAAGPKLPKPYVSRGLDSVLMPIDASVRRQFKLSPKAEGVLVISVKPGGVAAKSGMKPGDVISRVKGHKISKPIDLDTAVYYWIKKGISDFLFDGWRGQTIYHPRSTITLILYEEPIDIATVDDWVAVTTTDFSYTEYYEEYSTEITESYTTSESYIEETASSSEYSSEVTQESTHETSFESEEANASDHDSADDRDDDHDSATAPDDDHHDSAAPDDDDRHDSAAPDDDDHHDSAAPDNADHEDSPPDSNDEPPSSEDDGPNAA